MNNFGCRLAVSGYIDLIKWLCALISDHLSLIAIYIEKFYCEHFKNESQTRTTLNSKRCVQVKGSDYKNKKIKMTLAKQVDVLESSPACIWVEFYICGCIC